MARSFEERFAEKRALREQIDKQMQQMLQQHKAKERKARTRRLIEFGAILESRIDGANDLTKEQIRLFLDKTVQTPYARKILSDIKAQSGDTTAPKSVTSAEQADSAAIAAPADVNQTGGAAQRGSAGNGAGQAG